MTDPYEKPTFAKQLLSYGIISSND